MIDFKVNYSSADTPNVVSKGFIQQSVYTLSGGKVRRVLLAKTFEGNNNTNISCRAYGSINIDSDIAVLRIQGELML